MFDASRALEPAFQEQSSAFFWQSILANYAVDEERYLRALIALAQSDVTEQKSVAAMASDLISKVRAKDDSIHMIDALLKEYGLNTEEGILLMCLAEALMRIPDKQTADALIRDKVSDADWSRHVGRSKSTLVNASTWGLLLTGRVVKMDEALDGAPSTVWKRLVRRSGEPVIRGAMNQAMAIMGRQFVLGRDIEEALNNAVDSSGKGYSYSFDMLGESAMTEDDAARHFRGYQQAIAAAGAQSVWSGKSLPLSVSIKLSALHPRFESCQERRVLAELCPMLCNLVESARAQGVAITLDAEEMDRFELTLTLFERVFHSAVAQGWSGLGIAIQAYSKRALPALCWLNKLAKEQGDEIPVRLVKGAYWDNEIKHAQQMGIANYPVFTRKESTDTSYLACLRFLLSDYTRGALYPQLATHNAHTIASVLAIARPRSRRIELQRLHGMGDALYDSVLEEYDTPVRIYAPVGGHQELLPYLVRRLLENGANSSFVHRLIDAETPIESLVQDPVQELQKYQSLANDRIPTPPWLYGNERVNAKGWNLAVAADREALFGELQKWRGHHWRAGPVITGSTHFEGDPVSVSSPADSARIVGEAWPSAPGQIETAIKMACKGFSGWAERPVADRADCVQRFGELIEENCAELVALCSQEAGLPVRSGVDEVRDSVNVCWYYASQALSRFGHAVAMPGPTGETNDLCTEGKGVFLCISPVSSPMSVFCGQVAAALVTGNAVLAKPARQASLLANRLVELLLEAGVPGNVIQLLPGDGALVGSILISDPRIAGVAFTGSTQVAREINRLLADRKGAGVPLIAETTGHNAMIADSSALPEQVVRDALRSAFCCAGQHCSALRLLFLQEDVADITERLLAGAMDQLSVGDPASLDTDIGPVVDARARSGFEQYIETLTGTARLIGQAPEPAGLHAGNCVAPSAWEIKSFKYLKNECFGPILHVVRYCADGLDKVIDDINGLGYGLTLAIHSRSESTAAYIEKRVKAGSTYINRDQAGSKTGSPNYLLRFAAERTRTINTTALGGNASLLSLGIERV